MPTSFIGTEHAKRAAYMGGTNGEPLPAGMSHDLVRDEAILTRSDRDATCFMVHVRSTQESDEPLDVLTPRCKVDETEVAASIARETRAESGPYAYTARVERMAARASTASGDRASFVVTDKEARELRIVDRSAEICCPVGGGHNVRLWMKNRRVGFLDGRLVFDWELRPDGAPASATEITVGVPSR